MPKSVPARNAKIPKNATYDLELQALASHVVREQGARVLDEGAA